MFLTYPSCVIYFLQPEEKPEKTEKKPKKQPSENSKKNRTADVPKLPAI